MNETLEHIVIKLRQDKNYRIKFMNAYGDSMITGERILKCIAQFTLTLISSDAKYDQVKKRYTAIYSSGTTRLQALQNPLCLLPY
jgi:cytochrome c peroxidase